MPIHTLDLDIKAGEGCIGINHTFNGIQVGYYESALFYSAGYQAIDTVSHKEHAKLIASVYSERYKIKVYDLTSDSGKRDLTHEQRELLGIPKEFTIDEMSEKWVVKADYIEMCYYLTKGLDRTVTFDKEDGSTFRDIMNMAQIYLDIAELSKHNLHMIMKMETEYGIVRYEPDFKGNWRIFEYGSVMA